MSFWLHCRLLKPHVEPPEAWLDRNRLRTIVDLGRIIAIVDIGLYVGKSDGLVIRVCCHPSPLLCVERVMILPLNILLP